MKENLTEKQLIEEVENSLPTLVKAINENGAVIFHQDAFAADYQMSEFLLLGMAIKYIGLSGKEIHIIGKNGDTLKRRLS